MLLRHHRRFNQNASPTTKPALSHMFRRHVLARYRLYARRTKRYVLHNILHADDPPRKLALGIALAMFVTFTPTVGFQMVLVFFIAWLFRANKVVGVPLVWLSNPLTVPPIFYFNYWVGALVMGSKVIGYDWFSNLATHAPDAWWPKVNYYFDELLSVAVELWVGSIIVATILAVVTYFPCYYGICWYRMKRWGQLVPPVGHSIAHRAVAKTEASAADESHDVSPAAPSEHQELAETAAGAEKPS